MEKLFWAALQMINGIGASRLRSLISYFGSGEAVWKADFCDLKNSGCLDKITLENLIIARKKIDIDLFAENLVKKQIGICTIEEKKYPENLKNIFNPPVVLFYRGTFSVAKKSIAIVGARNASAYGKSCSQLLAKSLASYGIEIVSGAAKGIDTAAHLGALAGGGKTIAVLGSGIDVVYPKENKRLLDEIAEKGLILSEYGPEIQVNPKFFPARNRIISGIAKGVVVIEAAMKSGSLITAEFAINEGRDVFAVPGNIFSDLSKGCHKLIKQGAKLIEGIEDIVNEYSWDENAIRKETKEVNELSVEEKLIYQVLTYDTPMSIDEIILKTRSNVSNVSFILLQMELRGIIKEYTPRSYIRAIEEGVL